MQPFKFISQLSLALAVIAMGIALRIFDRLQIRKVFTELSGKKAADEITRINVDGMRRQGRGFSVTDSVAEAQTKLVDEPDTEVQTRLLQ